MTTSLFSSGSRILIATCLLFGTISTASAYTAEQQQLCTDDAFRLCSPDIPDVDRVTACMAKHKSELSAGCKSVFRATPATASATTTAPPTTTPTTMKPKSKARKSSKRPRKPVSQ